jgi:hypothetical protein
MAMYSSSMSARRSEILRTSVFMGKACVMGIGGIKKAPDLG